MRILFLSTRHNGLSQRAQVELEDLGHHVDVAEVSDGAQMEAAANRFRPDLILAPMLKSAIPAEVWQRHLCLIVHPGIPGDRGPSSLDWALLEDAPQWGVTVLEARDELDGGPIWAHREFPMRGTSKGAIYRRETTDAAMLAIRDALQRFSVGATPPFVSDAATPMGRERMPCRQDDRRIGWDAPLDDLLRHIRSADSAPGLQLTLAGVKVRVYGAYPEARLRGRPGELLAQRDGALCVACGDAALWISHLRRRQGLHTDDPRYDIKLPAAQVLSDRLQDVAEHSLPPESRPTALTWQPIRYRERGYNGYLHFDLLNGAMSTPVLERLLAAYRYARKRSTRTLVLCGGEDVWSNGIDLNAIEAAADPAQESWHNILAINALVREIVQTDDKRTVSLIQGNAGAGGVILALAADRVYAREGAVLNPHYRGMGGLYGSEYWTYLLPRRVGAVVARQLTESLQPLGTARAQRIGLLDGRFDNALSGESLIEYIETELAAGNKLGPWRTALAEKAQQRLSDEQQKPFEAYAVEELAEMRRNFFGPDPAYHLARRAFVRKQEVAIEVAAAMQA
ncbi:hydrogenase maturation protein [Dyella tabacisoli]|uniref:Hydrogenase maturation protein n=1 Tax=Dyella tabacisoli TaxID=2282381 RepID=A0A369UZB7_9GAMM|nr:hydrogenase maturation protein [Dyella tabacisoli]RDD83669.1 hydrogenase maturation protein [Dyella tabacisoli]